MSTPATKPKQENTPSAVRASSATKEMVLYFFIISGIAALLATLFTAWSPNQFQAQNSDPLSTPIILAQPVEPVPAEEIGAPTRTPRARKLIGIVVGHWKNDSGAVCADGLKEVDINLNVASLVQEMLNQKGYDVDLLAEFDSRLTSYEADAIISIHADSCDYINNLATGFKVATSLAKYQPEQSTRLTSCLRGRYSSITGLPVHSQSVTPDMTEYHTFSEIDPTTPAAIIEVGFLNLDRQFLTETPELAAQGIVSGIECFLHNEAIYQITPQVGPTTTVTP